MVQMRLTADAVSFFGNGKNIRNHGYIRCDRDRRWPGGLCGRGPGRSTGIENGPG